MAKSLEELRVYQREYAQKRRAFDPVFLEKCREAEENMKKGAKYG